MANVAVLNDAVKTLLESYKRVVMSFSLVDFLESGVDPFRFSFNVAILGPAKAVAREMEHKLAMKLENMVGDFHENYLGNLTHSPSGSRWQKVPSGAMPGVDIKNTSLNAYLQIKSKHNSMNSSSSKRLAQELEELKKKNPKATVGCGWVIASRGKACIGESYITPVATVLKGKGLFEYVSGNRDEMDEVVEQFPKIVAEAAKGVDFEALITKKATDIYVELEKTAKRNGTSVINLLYKNAVE